MWGTKMCELFAGSAYKGNEDRIGDKQDKTKYQCEWLVGNITKGGSNFTMILIWFSNSKQKAVTQSNYVV